MNERDRHLVRHLAKHFGTQRFTIEEAASSAARSGDVTASDAHPLPKDSQGWGQALGDLVTRDLAFAELEGFRLTEAVIRAATILNI